MLFSQTRIVVASLTIFISGIQAQTPTNPVPAAANAETPRKNVISLEARDQVKKVVPAIGLVMVRNSFDSEPKPRPRGSAVIVHKDGLVITNFHVVARDRSMKLYDEIYLSLPPDAAAEASASPRLLKLISVLTNPDRDLALLKIVPDTNAKPEAPLPAFTYLELGESNKIELLDDLFIIGFPEKGGSTVTVNYGVVEGKDTLDDWIKTDARIIHGNSGGAAVNLAGKLIGIPTRVVNDSDGAKTYGSVGYLRPAHLVGAMIARYREMEAKAAADKEADRKNVVIAAATPITANPPNSNVATKVSNLVTIRGLVKSRDGKPLAGVRVGLLHVGQEVAASSLITWGGTNAEGQFVLEKPVPPGKYNLRAKVIGYELYDLDLTVTAEGAALVIELKSSQE